MGRVFLSFRTALPYDNPSDWLGISQLWMFGAVFTWHASLPPSLLVWNSGLSAMCGGTGEVAELRQGTTKGCRIIIVYC